MGVYIKGMEMPTSCYLCPFCDYVSARCDAVKDNPYTPESRYEKRADFCPLVPVPPHGDLIDRKALLADTTDMLHSMMVFGGARVYTSDAIKNAPTIIPAEEGET